MGIVTGTVTSANGLPLRRALRLYRRDSGVLLGSAESDPITGVYSLDPAGYTGEANVVMLDDGTLENDQIIRVVIAQE